MLYQDSIWNLQSNTFFIFFREYFKKMSWTNNSFKFLILFFIKKLKSE